jgi:hypothetical protein
MEPYLHFRIRLYVVVLRLHLLCFSYPSFRSVWLCFVNSKVFLPKHFFPRTSGRPCSFLFFKVVYVSQTPANREVSVLPSLPYPLSPHPNCLFPLFPFILPFQSSSFLSVFCYFSLILHEKENLRDLQF